MIGNTQCVKSKNCLQLIFYAKSISSKSTVSKTGILTILEALNFDLHIVNSSSDKNVKNSQLPNFRGTETLKIVNLEYPN